MMYTVAMFGHREIRSFLALEDRLRETVKSIVRERYSDNFLVGCDGDFDRIASSAVVLARDEFGERNVSLTLVLPYPKASIERNIGDYEKYYDFIEVCEEAEISHYKKAFTVRNEYMADRADLVICYVVKASGGAWRAMRYAVENGKEVMNLGAF